MKNNHKTIIAMFAIIIIGTGIYYYKTKNATITDKSSVAGKESAVGCYVSTLAKDVYSLNIASQKGDVVEGTLVFDNFEKDSSFGPFKGTYKDGILLGDYSFRSEGMDSIMQVIFKKEGTDFVRGYGPMNATGDGFADLSTIAYDPNQTFKATTEECVTTL